MNTKNHQPYAILQIAAVIAVLLGSMLTASAGTVTIDTTSSFTGNSVYYWGTSDSTPTYGQVFTAPIGVSTLDSFEFFVKSMNANINFTAYVAPWVSNAVGTPIFTSTPQTVSASSNFTPELINTGGISLTAGNQYVAYFYENSGAGIGYWAAVPHAAYTGGEFVYGDSNYSPALNTSLGSSSTIGNSEMVLSFTTVVPEPSSWVLMMAGFGSLLLLHRRR